MTTSLLTGIATCAALTVFAGNPNAYTAHAHKTHKSYNTATTSTTSTYRGSVPNGTRVNTSPNGNEPIYESCEFPWRHPGVGCPYGR